MESLKSQLAENEKRVEALAKKMDTSSEILKKLHSMLKENEKKVDSLEKKLLDLEQKNPDSDEKVKETKSTPRLTSAARTILVLDDDKKLTTSFKLILESAGYIVDVANTGFTAHVQVTQNYYDLVLLDWHLRDALGGQIAETIQRKHNETKIIFITGYEYVLDELDPGTQILLKPIDPDYLLETVAKLFPNEENLHVRAHVQRYKKEQGIAQGSTAAPEPVSEA